MKTINSNLLIAPAIALVLAACKSNKSKDIKVPDNENVAMSMIVASEPEMVEDTSVTTIKFAPPLIPEVMEAKEAMVSISDLNMAESHTQSDKSVTRLYAKEMSRTTDHVAQQLAYNTQGKRIIISTETVN